MNRQEVSDFKLHRRHFLGLALGMACALGSLPAMATNLGSARRTLTFRDTHTNEKLKAIYWENGAYLPGALAKINHVLRDFRTGEVREIDVRLLDLLHQLRVKLKTKAPFEIISAYRSPATNAKLAALSGGIAKKSLHMKGMAIDIRLADRKLTTLRDVAIETQAGGVGYYPKSNFVHVDVGKVRAW
ncbi:MAG: DUF882 domain-containing protein [Dongiaceae bacterium]